MQNNVILLSRGNSYKIEWKTESADSNDHCLKHRRISGAEVEDFHYWLGTNVFSEFNVKFLW